jgi:hypothetical protein
MASRELGIDQKRGSPRANRNPLENVYETGDASGRRMQTRQSQEELTVYTLNLNKVKIPAKAVLHDFRLGPGHEGLAPHNPDVVSFHYDGQVYFNISEEIVAKTVIVMSTGLGATWPA